MECLALTRKGNSNVIETRELTFDLLKEEQVTWVHLKIDSRESLGGVEPNEWLTKELIQRLLDPGKSFLVERFGEVRILDCNTNYTFNEDTKHFLSFIFMPNVVLTISTVNNILSEDINPEDILDDKRQYDASLIVLTLFRKMLDRNSNLANEFTKKVDKILKRSIAKSFNMQPEELEKLHARAIDLSELFEDQLTTIRLLPMNIEEGNSQTLGFLDRVEKSMEHLVSITERSQDKLDYILQRYANVLQQRANARLNTLTIVQAIFVPLTFLAGIYGMNFVRMPELEWEHGYFYALSLMGIIGVGGLILFYKNGWFKPQ